MQYNDDFKEPTEKWMINGQEQDMIPVLSEGGILRHRREQLGMTQTEVCEIARIAPAQYSRLEGGERNISGTSMRIGLAVCYALKLDPYRFVPIIGGKAL